jgi:hypothetical protein
MEARVTKVVARVSARFSKSLARHRFRPNQGVRSITQPEIANKPVLVKGDIHAGLPAPTFDFAELR